MIVSRKVRDALVVQRIGHKIADLVIEVQFLAGAPRRKLHEIHRICIRTTYNNRNTIRGCILWQYRDSDDQLNFFPSNKYAICYARTRQNGRTKN